MGTKIEDPLGEPVVTPRTFIVASIASALLILVASATAPVVKVPTTQGTSK